MFRTGYFLSNSFVFIVSLSAVPLFAAEEREKNKPPMVQANRLTEEGKAFLDFLKQKNAEKVEKNKQPTTQGNVTAEEKEFLEFLNKNQ